MGFKSEAQRAKFKKLLKEGRISKAVFDSFESATGDSALPSRVEPPPRKNKSVKKIAAERSKRWSK